MLAIAKYKEHNYVTYVTYVTAAWDESVYFFTTAEMQSH